MSDPAYLTIRLPLKLGPLERYDLWEEPLTTRLEASGEGEVTGGGTMMNEEGEIQYCDLEVALPDLSDARLTQLQSTVEAIGAPKNTMFVDDDGETLRSFGTLSVVGVGLDGTDLPDSAYEGFDPDEFSDEVIAALGDGHAYAGSDAGARYTFFYYSGPDGSVIEDKLRQVTSAKPIGQGAQIAHLA